MPSRWQLLLRPTKPNRTKHVPSAQLHGLACHLLEGAGADHHAQTKPFSITPLMEAPQAPGNATVALSWLNDLTTPPLALLQGTQVRLGSQFFTVDDVQHSHAPYTALEALPATRRATLNFLSVTYFNRSGRWIPLPDPELLYGSLARRWNTFTPRPLTDDLIKDLLSTVRLTAHGIRSAPADLGQASRTGFTGHATFALPHSAPDELAVVFTTLSAYAEAAGTGAQTTHGLGWTTTTLHTPSTRSHHPTTIPSPGPVRRQPTQRTQSQQGV